MRVTNFGNCLQFDLRSGTLNMHREYRDLTIDGAVTQCYTATWPQIIMVESVEAPKWDPDPARLAVPSQALPEAIFVPPAGPSTTPND